MNRTALNSTEKSQVASSFNSQGKLVDPDTRQPLQSGKMDIGHRYGYEHSALSRCAERCHMTQKEFNQMIKENAGKIFHWQDRTQNRNHSHECKDHRIQNSKCMQLIRSFKNKNNGKNKQSAKQRNSKSNAKARAAKGMKVQGYEKVSMKATGNKIGTKGSSKSGIGKGGFGITGAKGSSIGAGKGGTSSGAKGGSSGSGGKEGSTAGKGK